MAKRPLEIGPEVSCLFRWDISIPPNPSVDANAEATRANAQAQQDMRAPHG